MANTIAISQFGGSIAGSGGASTPAAVTVGVITFAYIWANDLYSATSTPQTLSLRVPYTKPSGWTGTGVHAYVEDPDQSALPAFQLNGTTPLNGTTQLGGSWSPIDEGQFADDGSGYITLTLDQIPTVTTNIRVYLVAYNALSDPPLQRATSLTPSPSGVVTVTPPPSFASGVENAQLVTNLNADTQYAMDGEGQLDLFITITWTPPNDPNYLGVQLTLFRPAPVTVARSGGGGASPAVHLQPVRPTQTILATCATGNTLTTTISSFPTVTEFATLSAVSIGIGTSPNTIVNGVTPSIPVEIDPPPSGDAGMEETSILTAFTAVVNYQISGDGVETYNLTGAAGLPNDPSFGGFTVYLHNEANGTDHSQDVPLGNYTSSPWATQGNFPIPSPTQTYDAYAVSFDVNHNPNTLDPGVTPRVTGLEPVLQTAGSLLGNRLAPGTLPVAAFASGIMPVLLNATDPALPNALYPPGTIEYNTTSLTLKKVNAAGTAWEPLVNGGTDIFANTITAGQMAAGAIGTTQLYAGVIQVGGSSGMPGMFQVMNAAGTLQIGFIGTDSFGNEGAHFVTCHLGGSTYASAPFQADSSGNLSLSGSNVTVSITNSSGSPISTTVIGGAISGIQSTAGTSQGNLYPGLLSVTNSTDTVQADTTFSGAPELIITTGSGSTPSSGEPQLAIRDGSTIALLTSHNLRLDGLPSSNPGSGSKQFWYDPTDSNRVKFAP